jgi:hypothetical protein
MIVEPYEWKRRVCLNGCQIHDDPTDCSGPVEGHHLISRQSLRKRGLSYLDWDTRNGFAACQRAHRRHTGAVERIPYEKIPEAALEFAREAGLEWQLDRFYPRTSTLSGDTENPGFSA